MCKSIKQMMKQEKINTDKKDNSEGKKRREL